MEVGHETYIRIAAQKTASFDETDSETAGRNGGRSFTKTQKDKPSLVQFTGRGLVRRTMIKVKKLNRAMILPRRVDERTRQYNE